MGDRLGVDKWDKRLERGVNRIERSFSNFERGLAKFERGVEGRVADMMNEDETKARNRKTRERARVNSANGWVKESSEKERGDVMKDEEMETITAPQDPPFSGLISSESSLPLPTPPASPPDANNASPSILNETLTDSPLSTSVQVSQTTNGTSPPNPAGPILSPSQLRMVHWLNSVPSMKKHIVFLDHLRNSHGTIVCRDMETYDFHKRGEGVLRHWADGYLL